MTSFRSLRRSTSALAFAGALALGAAACAEDDGGTTEDPAVDAGTEEEPAVDAGTEEEAVDAGTEEDA